MPVTPAGVLFAHPLTESYQLPVPPLLAANAAAALVFLLAFAVPGRPRRPSDGPVTSWAGSLTTAQVVTRTVAMTLLGLAIAAGRLGADDQLENLAPALVVGAGWPLLVLASLLVGSVWRWLDPWDGIARALAPADAPPGPRAVWPAVPFALVWVWYLSAYSDPLDPRAVGAVLALYSVVTVGGCLALGRARWLGTAEPLGIVLSWMALLPRRRLGGWDPPPGAAVLLGVLAGGVLFGAVRRSELWGSLNTVQHADLVAALGVLGSCVVASGLLALMATSTAGRAAVISAALPAVAGVIVAVAMDRNRLFTSVQLLPGVLGDPFGEGWDLLGTPRLDPAPLGTTGLLVAQLATLLAGYLAGAVVFARLAPPRARTPSAAGLAVLAGLSVIAVMSH
ncbi:MAG TPA: hypothetical protein VFP78_21220 [Solirubrobacteraceae bacterium]|nr:hypothetical protein [Solirubrobacteraceae bacterium]